MIHVAARLHCGGIANISSFVLHVQLNNSATAPIAAERSEEEKVVEGGYQHCQGRRSPYSQK